MTTQRVKRAVRRLDVENGGRESLTKEVLSSYGCLLLTFRTMSFNCFVVTSSAGKQRTKNSHVIDFLQHEESYGWCAIKCLTVVSSRFPGYERRKITE
jgi:hypothetical protein